MYIVHTFTRRTDWERVCVYMYCAYFFVLSRLLVNSLMAAAVDRIALQVQQVLEQAQFALDRETARRVRLDKKYSELEDRGLVSPRSLSPRVWRPDTASRKIHQESERSQTSLPRPSSARYHTDF